MATLGNETVYIIRAPLVAGRTGGEERVWSQATETPVEHCSVQPFPLAEKLNFEESRSREHARTAYRIYAPPGTDVLATDRVRWNGVVMDVFGHAGPWHRRNGSTHHITFIGRERSG